MIMKAFDKIAGALKEAIEISQGRADPASYRVHVPSKVDVKAQRLSPVPGIIDS